MYKRRKKENGLEGVGQRKVILVYERSRHTAMSKEETFKSGKPPQNAVEPTMTSRDSYPLKHNCPGHRDTQTRLLIPSKPTREFSLDMEDLDISWTDLVLKGRIGSGIYAFL